MAATDDESPGRALLVALGAMAGVALLAGVAIGLVVMAVVRFAGVGETAGAAEEAPQSLFIPKYSPTGGPDDDIDLPSVSAQPSLGEPSEEARANRITLFVAPQNVAPGERINFNGVYNQGEGVELQIQRREGGAWTDFPVTAIVRGGTFSTWIESTRTGRSPFRVFDAQADRASNQVIVTIG